MASSPISYSCGEQSPVGKPYLPPRAILCLAAMVVPLAMTVYMWVALAAYPYDWDAGEGDNIYYAWRLGHGQPIYSNYNEFPMTGSCYPPVYHALCSPWAAMFGRRVIIGRMVSWLALIGTSACIWMLARRMGAPRWAALIAGLIYIACPAARQWGALARVDSTLTALGFLSLVLLTSENPSRRGVLLGVLVGVAATYTKPYGVLFPLAGLALLAMGHRKLAFIGLMSLGVSDLALLGLLQLWSHGWFWNNVVSANATDFFTEKVWIWGDMFLRLEVFLLVLVFAGLAQARQKARRVLLAALIVGVAISLFLGKRGAGENYLLPFAAAIALAAGSALHQFRSFRQTWIPVFAIVATMWQWSDPRLIPWPRSEDRAAMDTLAADLAAIDGELLVERFATLQDRAGKPMVWEPCLLHALHKAGKWRPDRLIEGINAGRFAALLTSGELFNPGAAAFAKKFRKAREYTIRDAQGTHKYTLSLYSGGAPVEGLAPTSTP